MRKKKAKMLITRCPKCKALVTIASTDIIRTKKRMSDRWADI